MKTAEQTIDDVSLELATMDQITEEIGKRFAAQDRMWSLLYDTEDYIRYTGACDEIFTSRAIIGMFEQLSDKSCIAAVATTTDGFAVAIEAHASAQA